jgi:hypothetical protein
MGGPADWRDLLRRASLRRYAATTPDARFGLAASGRAASTRMNAPSGVLNRNLASTSASMSASHDAESRPHNRRAWGTVSRNPGISRNSPCTRRSASSVVRDCCGVILSFPRLVDVWRDADSPSNRYATRHSGRREKVGQPRPENMRFPDDSVAALPSSVNPPHGRCLEPDSVCKKSCHATRTRNPSARTPDPKVECA